MSIDRRRFLALGGGSLSAALLAACDSRGPRAAERLLRYAERKNESLERVLLRHTSMDRAASTRVAGAALPSYFVSPTVPIWDERARGAWTLAVTGMVRTPEGKAMPSSPSFVGRAPVPPELKVMISKSSTSAAWPETCDPPRSGGTYAVTVRLRGRRIGVKGRPSRRERSSRLPQVQLQPLRLGQPAPRMPPRSRGPRVQPHSPRPCGRRPCRRGSPLKRCRQSSGTTSISRAGSRN